jgi:hypothetical protein
VEASTDEEKLITHALLSYADACTSPTLTPNCPYYRQTDSGPTCEEECRPISVRHGAPERPVGTRHVRQAPPRDLSADSFVQPAMRFLMSHEYSRAAAIFEEPLKLRPGDSEVLDNLGFCLLPVDKSAALLRLQEATSFEVHNSNVNSANRALALHLLGRDTDALEVISLTLNNSEADSACL